MYRYEEVRRKLDIDLASGGIQHLKNIENPVAVYHVGTAADVGLGREASARAWLDKVGSITPRALQNGR